jgi:hypothetical protein
MKIRKSRTKKFYNIGPGLESEPPGTLAPEAVFLVMYDPSMNEL